MKKKVFSLMMTLLLAFVGVAKAEVVTIGEGTSTYYYYPVNMYFHYSLTEQLYTPDEIGTAGTINAISFYYANSSAFSMSNVTLYMKNVEREAFASNTDMEPLTLGDIVWTGTFSASGEGWVTIELDTPFAYDGVSNLLVAGFDGTSGYPGSAYKFRTSPCTGYKGIQWYSDSYCPDPYNTAGGFSGSKNYTQYRSNIQLDITPGGGGGTSSDPEIGLHVRYDNGEEGRELVIDDLYLGEYPAGAWMEPFHFEMYNDDTQALTVSVLDFTPNTDALSMATGTELPFTVAGNSAEYIDLAIQVQAPADAEAGDYEYQFVAIYEGSRLAKIWPLSFTIYTPEVPDVVEKAHDFGTIGAPFSYTGIPSQITPTVLHDDYTLPFPEIPEGVDAVYKFTVEGDMILNAYVDETNADGKVALYTEDFNGEAGPMATNNYTAGAAGGAGGITITQDFESGLGDWTMANCHASTGVTEGTSSYPAHDGNYCFRFRWTTNPPQYLISPELEATGEVNVSFFHKNSGGTYYVETFHVGYSTTTNDPAAFTFGEELVAPTTWTEYTTTLPAGTKYVAIKHTANDQFYLFLDDITITAGRANRGIAAARAEFSAGPVIENLPIQAGTYYLVTSSTDADYTVYINADDMPCPDAAEAVNGIYPADDEAGIEPASVTLKWDVPTYATGWRLVFGSTYYPEEGHPQTVIFPEDGSFSTDMVNSYTVTDLWNNTNYFWHVEFNNSACADGVSTPIWGFTTHLNKPHNLVATPDMIFEGETTTLTWNAITDRTYRSYRIYKDGVLLHTTPATPNPEANLTWTVPASELTYNMGGYTFNVTAVYDEGESDFSNDAIVKVSGYSAAPGIYGYAYEQDGTTPIGGVTVTVTGTDEFGNAVNYSATTNADGYYTMHPVLAGEYATALAYCAGYQDAEPYTNVPPFTLPYQGTWGEMNFIMHEEFYPSPMVCAEVVQVGDDELVKVWWQIPDGTGGTGTGDFMSEYEAQVGNGAQETGYVPFYTLYDNSVSMSLYTAAELSAAGATPAPMTSISWQAGNQTGYAQQGITIWMANVTDTQVPTTTPNTANMTKVYTGSMTPVTGWNEFAFNAGEFAWDGTSNLLILVQRNNGTWNSTVYWKGQAAPNMVSYKYQDNTAFDVENTPVTGMTTTTNVRPNIILKGGMRADRADRAMHHYRIYRTDCYNDGPYTEENTVVLASAWVPDTAYFDVSWPDAAPGVYKWGVGVVYEGNQADNPNNPREEGITYGFEGNLEGWTTIDVNAAGGSWIHSDDNYGGYDYASVAHGGAGFAMSYSFIDYVGSFDTDSYLVSPQSYSISNGSSLKFFYDFANDSYPDFFEVCVATTAGTPTAADFTSVWTLGAKAAKVANDVRHNADRYGNWREVNVDLSAYAGQNVWIAFHHDDYDMYEVWIDDVTITGAGGGVTPTPGNTCNNLLALPRESCTVWSNECSGCIDKDMDIPSLEGEQFVSVNVVLNSADSPVGTVVSFTNLHAGEQAAHPQEAITLDETGHHDFETFRRGSYAIQIYHEGFYTIFDTVGIGVEPDMAYELRYVMEEILYPARDFYVSYTGFAMWDIESGWEGGEVPSGGGGGGGTGANSFTEGFEGSLNGWNTIKVNAAGGEWLHSDNNPGGYAYAEHAHGGTGFAMCYSFVDYVGAYDTDAILYTPQKYDIVNGSTLTFWADNANDAYPESFSVVVATVDNPTAADFTQVWSGNAKGSMGQKANVRHSNNRIDNWRLHTVDLSNYAGQSIWIGFRDTNYDAYEIFIDDVELSTGRSTRHFEYYKVMCTSIDGQPIFNVDVTTPYCQLATDQLVENETYICKVAAVFSTGMSEWRETQWVYRSCENYAGTLNGVTINGNTISWDYPGGGVGPVPPVPPTGDGDTFTINFDDSQIPAGWTIIDNGNPAGYGWQLASNKIGTGNGHNGSTDCILSQSYDNNYGVVYPDNWFISPAVTLANGSTFSLWACGQDAGYAAEHFGVFVSTTGTNPSDFTMVNEWTIGAKSDRYDGPRGNRDQSTWTQYTVDLSAYAGTGRYIAIRHFNCSDMFYLDVDDLVLSNGGKANKASARVSSIALNGIAGNSNDRDEWLTYATNDNVENAFGFGGAMIKMANVYPNVAAYNGQSITKVAFPLYCNAQGNIEIYQGGTTAPTTLVYSQPFNLPGTGESAVYNEIDLTTPVVIDGSQSLWIVVGSDNYTDYPFIVNDETANAQYQYAYLEGYDWNLISEVGGSGVWLLKAYVEEGTTPTPTPTPAEGIIGAAIYQNGQPVAFVDYPTNTWTMPESGEYCVRIIYDGPMDGSFYSMSCEECEGGEVTCEANFTINGEYFWNSDDDFGARLWWGEGGVNPDPDPDPIVGDGDTFTINFDDSQIPAGWTIIDNGNPAGYGWQLASEKIGTGNGHNGSTDCILSQSYDNNYGVVYPDNWFISPAVTLANGSTFSLWACGQDAGYAAEHFGVFVSTTGTNPSDFVMVNEWTIGAKSDRYDGPRGNRDQSTWTQYVVDLSAYAGTGRYIAIRHFSCSDMFYLDVDDLELSNGRNRDGVVLYNIYRSTDNVNYELIDTVEAEAGVTEYEYIDNTAEAGVTYYYQVTAVYDNDCESTPALVEGSTNDYVVIGVTSIGENTGKVALYPNPTSGNVKIEANGMRHITVVSSLGQVVYDADVNADEMDLNMGQFTTGVYVVRIVTETGINTQRVTVVR